MPLSISSYVPQCAAREEPGAGRALALLVWGALAAGALAFVGLIVGAPLMLARGQLSGAGAVYHAFGLVCHQMPERSFHLAGHPLAVCARCAGLYWGFAAATLVYPLARAVSVTQTPARAWLLLAALPAALDFALGFFHVWENTHLSRALTGALLGAVAVFYVVPGLVDLGRAITLERRFTAVKALLTPLKAKVQTEDEQ